MADDYTKDKSFLSASPEDQHSYLMSVDPGYAKASPDEQKAFRGSLGLKEAKAAPDLRTGEGMEARAAQQAHQGFTGTGEQGHYDTRGRKVSGPEGQPLTLLEKAAQDQADRQTRLGTAENRASRSPAPFTNAAALYAAPAAASKEGLKALGRTVVGTVGGGVAGGYGGREIGGIFGHPEEGRQIGAGIGSLAGGYVGGFHPDSFPSEGRLGRLFDFLRPEAPPEFPGASLPSSEEFYANRGRELNAMRRLQPEAFTEPKPELGSPENPGFHSKLPTRMPRIVRPKEIARAPFEGMVSSGAPGGEGLQLPPASELQGKPTLFPEVRSKVAGPAGAAEKPFEPLVWASPEEAAAHDMRMQNLQRQARSAGTYHAAQGATGERLNLQQRIGQAESGGLKVGAPTEQKGLKVGAPEAPQGEVEKPPITEEKPHRFSNSAKTRKEILDKAKQ